MSKPDRLCWRDSPKLHIGTCCDTWGDGDRCVCKPADASQYPTSTELYAMTSIAGVRSANIKTYFNDVLSDTYSAKSGWTWMWVSWVSGGWYGKVRFDLCSGSRVLKSRTTYWGAPPDPCAGVECKDICIGADKYSQGCVTEGVDAGTCVFDQLIEENSPDCPGYVPPYICDEGSKRGKVTCWDGSIVHKEVCSNNKWVPTGETCPEKICDEGSKRGKVTCWDGSVIHKEICIDNDWVPTKETCPEKPSDDEDDDIQSLLDTIGISREHATAAITIVIAIIILRRLL